MTNDGCILPALKFHFSAVTIQANTDNFSKVCEQVFKVRLFYCIQQISDENLNYKIVL